MHITTIELGKRSYRIYLGTNIVEQLHEIYHTLRLPQRVVIVCDTNVARLHLKRFRSIFQQHNIVTVVITIPSGERQKSIVRARKIYDALINNRCSRNDAIVAFGGGVVGDLAGFVAATFRRGMPLIQVPTTLLAQVESAIGGKTGVNHPLSKNAIGAFYQPKLVFSDVQFLSTLPRREIICGLGEIIKYGYLDENVLTFLERHLVDILKRDPEVLERIILQCNAIKARLIAEDELETQPSGGRAVLNLGHTIGQALEVLSHYKLRHGEAVLIGLKWELLIAHRAGVLKQSDFERLWELVSRIPFKPNLKHYSTSVLIKHLYGSGRTVRFVLPQSVGNVIITANIDSKIATSIIKKMLQRQVKTKSP